MSQSTNEFKFNFKGKEYTFRKGDYFRANFSPTINKKPNYVLVDFFERNNNRELPIFRGLAQTEWKRIMKLGLLQFKPDKTNRHIRRFYLKD